MEPLHGDGSDRAFFRLRDGSRRAVLVVSPRRSTDEVDECDAYDRIGRHLAAKGLPVPRFLSSDPRRGVFVLQDLGNLHLQDFVNRSRTPRRLARAYTDTVRLLVRLHRRGAEGFESAFCFDTDRYDARFIYQRELEYFRRAFLNETLGCTVVEEDLGEDFLKLAALAEAPERRWVMHRDFQSRNLMVHGGALWIIDFQGMRFGPPAYDLASLLIDPYTAVPETLQEILVQRYWNAARGFLDVPRNDFLRSYQMVRLCRNLQMLGAFGFLGTTKGKSGFLAYVPRAWKTLRKTIEGPCGALFPSLRRWVRLADERIGSGAYRQRIEPAGSVTRASAGETSAAAS